MPEPESITLGLHVRNYCGTHRNIASLFVVIVPLCIIIIVLVTKIKDSYIFNE